MKIGVRGAATALTVALLEGAARADDTTVVHVESDGSTWAPGSQPTLAFAERLPEGTAFTLALDVPSTRTFSGIVQLWPELESATANQCDRPKDGAVQSYRRSLAQVDESGTRSLRATFPPLQVNQTYCARYDVDVSLDTVEAEALALAVARRLGVRAVADLSPDPMSGVRHDDICRPGPDGVIVLDAVTAEIAASLWAGHLTLDAVAKSRLVLGVRAALTEPCVSWLSLADKEAAANQLSKDAQEALDEAGKAVDAAKGKDKKTKAAADAAHEIAQERSSAAHGALKTATEAVNQYAPKLVDAVEGAVLAVVKEQLRSNLVGTTTPSEVSTETRNSSNYVDLTGGAVLALWGVKNEGARVWMLPFAGVRLHFTAIERKIRFRDMTGTTADKVGQRLGLQIGVSAGKPILFDREVRSAYGTVNPMLGVSVRLMSFMEVDVGAFIFGYDDRDPTSDRLAIGAAPYVSLSFDVDLVKSITTASGQ